MDIIYNAIIDRLNANKDLFTTNGMDAIKHIDLFKGQYINPEMHPAYKKPAVFYSWGAAWEDKIGLTQEGKLTIQIHLEISNRAQSFGGARDKDSGLLHFKYQTYVNALLHGFSTALFNPLKRRANEPDKSPTDTNVQLITYETKLVDDTAKQLVDSGYQFATIDDVNITTGLKEKTADVAPQSDYYVMD